MPLPGRLFADDKELGKKDDDYVPGKTDLTLDDTLQWARLSVSTRVRRRRIALVGLFILGLIFWITNVSGSSAPPPLPKAPVPNKATPKSAPTGAPPRPQLKSPNELHYYDGPSKYYSLSKSLQGATRSQGLRLRNKNILFAAANLQSLDRLLPMACEMAKWNRNMVHVAVMGRHDVSIEEIIEINNVGSDCDILWHDARPDYAKYSTDARFSQSVFLTLEHMRNWIHPQAYIVENEEAEDQPFLKSVTKHAHRHETAVIRLPQNAMQTLQWIARLDTGSLSAWEKTRTEILIRAPSGSSGSLIRLLRSIEKADYFGLRPPHLTIELPSNLDQHTEEFLENFVWPPHTSEDTLQTSQVTLQRRLLREQLNPVESSMRYIEGFWPTRPRNTHVLMLSSEIQLSPLYYHFLFYNLLEYKYSTYAVGTRDSESLVGISLVSPRTLPDGKTPLKVPPSSADEKKNNEYSDTPFFQLQAPDTHACLYFGDKWKELHSFFSLRLDSPTTAEAGLVAKSEPAYAAYFLELMRARGYFVLHPGRLDTELATSHTELYQPPEEWVDPDPEQNDVDDEPLDSDMNGELLSHHAPAPPRPHLEHTLAWTPLHVLLPYEGDLPELSSVPLLSHTGQKLSVVASDRSARLYTSDFQLTAGGCRDIDSPPRRKEQSAQDLFCEHYGDLSSASLSAGLGRGPPLDEYGDMIPPPMPEAERKQMEAEFVKHLQRQSQGQRHEQEQVVVAPADAEEGRSQPAAGDKAPSTDKGSTEHADKGKKSDDTGDQKAASKDGGGSETKEKSGKEAGDGTAEAPGKPANVL